jgi:hypothetical protein
MATIGLQLGSVVDEIGTSEFFHAFFSTISGNLEQDEWGSRFPTLLEKLYAGELIQSDAQSALKELDVVASELARLPSEKVIWDVEHPDRQPPWGKNISADITDLSNYFVTSTGRDLVGVLREVLEELRDRGGVLKIVSV